MTAITDTPAPPADPDGAPPFPTRIISPSEHLQYLLGETSETFDPDEYLRSKDRLHKGKSLLATNDEYRRIATKLDPMLFALIYLRHHLRAPATRNQITFCDAHLDWCKEALGWCAPSRMPRADRDVFVAPRELGKALALDTPIPTPAGWTTMGEIQPGDELFDQDGAVCRVMAKSQVWNDSTYRVHFGDGTHVDTHANHEWVAVDARYKGRYSTGRIGRHGPRTGTPTDWRNHWGQHTTVTTQRMAENLRFSRRGDHRWLIPNARALELPTADLPIDPYVLGFWLGDGTASNGQITVNAADYPELAHRFGDHTRPPSGERGGAYRINVTGLIGKLRALGLRSAKHIPTLYLRASIQQRRELVRGLMDSDGYRTVAGGDEIGLNDVRLAGDVIELFRSMGLATRMHSDASKLNGRVTGTRYRINTRFDFRPYHLTRYDWAPATVQASRMTSRTVTAIEELDPRPTQCITVDSPSHLFLAGRAMVPTHNSTWFFLILPLWAAAHGHRKFIAAFADSGTQAEMHLSTFKNELDANALLMRDYPLLCEPATRRRGMTQSDTKGLTIRKSGFVFGARGADSKALGMKVGHQRPDLLILDDIEPGEDQYSEYQVTGRLTTIVDVIFPLSEYARVVLVGTVTLPGSIVHQLVKSVTEPDDDVPEWIGEQNMRVHYYPPIIANDDGTERSIWPAKWPISYLQAIRHTRSFLKNFANSPLGLDGDYWSKDDFAYSTLEGKTRVMLSIDPAGKDKKTSDWTGLAVVGWAPPAKRGGIAPIDPDDVQAAVTGNLGMCEVMYAKAVKLIGERLRAEVLRILEMYPEIGLVLIEVNQGGEHWLDILHHLPCKIQMIDQTVDKRVRASQSLAHYQRHRVVHSQRLNGAEEQMVSFPRGPNDDMVDAIGSAVTRLLRRPKKPGMTGANVGNYV